MAPKRLSDHEKNEIVDLYRQPEETTSTLASRYGVSSSTISRILKQNLSADEYDALVQQKRTGSGKPSIVDSNLDIPGLNNSGGASAVSKVKPEISSETEPEAESAEVESDAAEKPSTDSWAKPKLRGDRTPAAPRPSAEDSLDQPSADESDSDVEARHSSKPSPSRRHKRRVNSADADTNGHQPTRGTSEEESEEAQKIPAVASEIDDDDDENDDAFNYSSFDDDDDDLADELDDDFSDDDDDDEDDDDDASSPVKLKSGDLVTVVPFDEVELPRTCYLVIDRFAELIAPPLRDFAELGKIPEEEMTSKTLPVFDNHRVAKRFANRRTQRIVKVPDGQMLAKTMPYLSAKGITRLLLDGQVYSLID